MALIFLPFTFVVVISVFYESIAEVEVVPMKSNNNNDAFCDRGCQQEINTAIDYASSLNQYQSANHESLVKRINALENQMTTALGIGTNKYNRNIGNTNNGDFGEAMDVYRNLTKRIDNLQYGSINSLVSDNNIWKQNFRVVNATFEKIKLNTNKCVCRSYSGTN